MDKETSQMFTQLLATLKSQGVLKDVEIGGHSCRTRLTAVNASEALMSGRARWTARTASSVMTYL